MTKQAEIRQPPREAASGGNERAPICPPIVDLWGVPFWCVTEAQFVDYVLDRCKAGEGGWIMTPNLDILRKCVREPAVREFLPQVTAFVADGMPLIWAARLQGTPLPQRVCGSNLIWSLSAGAAERELSVFLVGGEEGTAEAAAEVLKRHQPNLRVAGTYYPTRGFEDDPQQMQRLTDAVCTARPDIVYVGLGCPKQERLIRRLRERLPGAWWMGVGISFSYVCGHVRRAPRWMQICGLEWLYRLSQEPARLIRRYLIDDIPFGIVLLIRSLGRRFRSRPANDADSPPNRRFGAAVNIGPPGDDGGKTPDQDS